MFDNLYPDAYYDSIFEIPYGELLRKNCRGLVFDIDNTLAPYDAARPDDRVTKLMTRLQKMGFQVCLLSNNNKTRITRFNEGMNLFTVVPGMKPLRGGLRKAMRLMGTARDNTALIGDQVFTDVLCAKRAGVYAVLVKPLTNRDTWIVRRKRGLERKIVAEFLRRSGR